MAKTIQKTCQMKYAVHGRRAHKRTFLVIFMSFASTGFCFFFDFGVHSKERKKSQSTNYDNLGHCVRYPRYGNTVFFRKW